MIRNTNKEIVFPSNNENPFKIRVKTYVRFMVHDFISAIISSVKRKTKGMYSWWYWQNEDTIIFNLLILGNYF